jgi:drug/metabolite transporter (DMT)-like permease
VRSRLALRLEARAEYRFGLVLALLLATFIFLMTGSDGAWARPVTVGLAATTLLAALFAADASPRLLRITIVIAVVALGTSLATVAVDGDSINGAAALLAAGLVAIAPIAIVRSVVRRRAVDIQTVLAALCIYVLFGMLWAFVFSAIGHFDSSPFFVQDVNADSADYLYFSFITQLTVGYGDLSAAGNFGRACAALEALIGQLYLVTVVAVLVTNLRRVPDRHLDEVP